jgi:hypothetical protein
MKYLSIISLVILLFTACIPQPILVDAPEEPQRIIVSSQVLPDFGLVVVLSNSITSLRSVYTGGTGDGIVDSNVLKKLLIDNASVTLSFDGKTEKLKRIGLGLYGTVNLKLVENKNYTLNVKDSLTGREVSATTAFAPPTDFDSLSAKIEISSNGLTKDTLLMISTQLTDNPAQKNYYLIDYINKKYKNPFGAVLSTLGIDAKKSSVDLFTSDIADAKHKIKINKTFIQNTRDTFTVTLFKVTKEYYEYQNSIKKSDGLFSQLASEPISLPTNVKNGQGFFNMAYPNIRTVYAK